MASCQTMRLGLAAAVAAALAACGDDKDPTIFTGDVRADLAALPGVASVEEVETAQRGYRYYVLQFDQPVDHDNPGGPHFLQKVSLLHHDLRAPMIAHTSGYSDYYEDAIVELTALLAANQISIEHRFFAGSRPDPADWSKLTIAQMAHDEHAIVTALESLYEGSFITTGASKGGMTAIFYRRFYPDDVDGTVPYVAPISFGAPDTRYNAFVDTLGPADCRQAVRDLAIEMLANRRAQISALAQTQAEQEQYSYTRIAFGPAVESAIFNLEWSFWQYFGVGFCPDVPDVTATDEEMFDFLDDVSPVSDNDDGRIAEFDAYYYQAYNQLGYPDGGAAYLDPYLMYTDADYLDALPTAQPTYDGGVAMMDIDQWVRSEGNRLLFVYGEWDPWTAGAFDPGSATESVELVQPEGTHNSHITQLTPPDREAAYALLEAWTGVTPKAPQNRSSKRAAPLEPRVPPAIRRALSARRKSP